MSALAVYLETAGIATTTIGLVRLHLEKIRPPRALWVPFEMGRPLGQPNNPRFQMRVLRCALRLLTAPAGPVVLTDFPEDEPGTQGDLGWRPPDPSAPKPLSLLDEVRRLQPWYAAAQVKFGRTTVGVSGLDIVQAAQYVQRFCSAEPLPKPPSPLSSLALLRFACDDLKAYYLEAASATGGRPSSKQLCDWFWQRTLAARRLYDLRESCLAGAERERRWLGDSLVPRAYLG